MASWAIIEAKLNNVSAKTCHTVIAMIIPSFLQQQQQQQNYLYKIHLLKNIFYSKKCYLFLSLRASVVSKFATDLVVDFITIMILNMKIISITLETINILTINVN